MSYCVSPLGRRIFIDSNRFSWQFQGLIFISEADNFEPFELQDELQDELAP